MADTGMMTRGRRNRSQSREVGVNGVAGAKTSRNNNLEAVAEVVPRVPSPGTPSQKTVRTESSMSINFNGSQATNANGSASRAVSPAPLSVSQQKEELQNLNDRLAKILNKLNDSEEENKILKVRLTTIEQETSADLADQVNQYRAELERARLALDNEANMKNQELLAKEKALNDLRESNGQLQKLSSRINEAETRMKAAEKLARSREQMLGEAEAALFESDSSRKRLEKELEDISQQLRNAQEIVEQEVLHRSRLENALKTAEEKATFDLRLLDSKLERRSVNLSVIDSCEVTSPRRSGVDFAESLMDLRTALDDAREEIYENMENMYRQELDHLQDTSAAQRETTKALQAALDASRDENKNMQKEHQQVRNKVAKLEKELEQANQKFDQLKYENASRLGADTDYANDTSNLYQQLLKDHRDLQDAYAGIRTELDVYRKLLDTLDSDDGSSAPQTKKRKYEATFGTPSQNRVATPLNLKSSKPMSVVRTTVKTSQNKSHASGAVRILEVVPGTVVRIENTGDADVTIGSWVLKQRGRSGESSYTFNNNQQISGHSIISVYSAPDSSRPYDGVVEILAENPWVDSGDVVTVLQSDEGESKASYEVSAGSKTDQSSEMDQSTSSPRPRGGLLGRLFGN